jgi:hypothetical protein
MRRFLGGVLLPVGVLASILYVRTSFDHHAWEWQWDIWIGFVIAISVQLGWGLRLYWKEGR